MRYILILLTTISLISLSGCRPDYPKCNTDEHCKAKGEFCVHGLCQQCRSVSDCGRCESCDRGRCIATPGCCVGGADCAAGQVCHLGFCSQTSEVETPIPDEVGSEEEDSKKTVECCTASPIYFAFDSALLDAAAVEAVQAAAGCRASLSTVSAALDRVTTAR